MKNNEFAHIAAAVLIMFVVSGLAFVFAGRPVALMNVFVFSVIVVGVPVVVRKLTAYSLDSNVEHSIWNVYQWGFKNKQHFKKEIPFGIIAPLFLSVFSLGFVKMMTFLTYETRALKHRAAKRFGYYSFTSMTDWHNGLIGAAGIVSLFLIALIAYIPGFEYLSKMAAYYAFWNMLPISNLDGSQIFFGSRILWTVLAFLSLILALYAFVLSVY